MSTPDQSAPPYLVNGPLRPTWGQGLLTAGIIALVALLYAVALPAYALSVSQLTAPVGSVQVDRVTLVPVSGWEIVGNAADSPGTVTLVKQGVRFSVREAQVRGTPQQQADVLIDQVVGEDPSINEVSESFRVRTPSDDPGVIVYLTSPQQSVAVAVVSSESAGVAAEIVAVGPSALVSELSGEIEEMVGSVRILRTEAS